MIITIYKLYSTCVLLIEKCINYNYKTPFFCLLITYNNSLFLHFKNLFICQPLKYELSSQKCNLSNE